MSVELALRKIRVNSISPGIVGDTEMTKECLKQLPEEWSKENQKDYPLGWVSAVDVANACVFLLSKESNKITGTNIIIDGGFSSK